MNYQIVFMQPSDWEAVREIYLEGIGTKIATFQNEAPSWEEWDLAHIKSCRLVVKNQEEILGWAALSPVSSRCVYAGVAEVSIYIGQKHRGKQLGIQLLNRLIELSEAEGYWTLQSGIIKENTSSINLHKRCGFREIGFRERVGRMDNGKWHDVVLVERRSRFIGQ